MPDFQFEVFKRRSKPKHTAPTVTLQRRGTFSMNERAFEALKGAEAVELLYDSRQKVIGIRAIDANAQHAYPVRRQGKGATWLIAGLAFCEYYDIPLGTARRYVAEPFGDDGMIVIDLKKESTEVVGPRSKAGAE